MPTSDGLLALFQLAYDNTTREGEMVTRSGRYPEEVLIVLLLQCLLY